MFLFTLNTVKIQDIRQLILCICVCFQYNYKHSSNYKLYRGGKLASLTASQEKAGYTNISFLQTDVVDMQRFLTTRRYSK